MKFKYFSLIIVALLGFLIAPNVSALTIEKVNVYGGINLRTGPGTNYKIRGTAKYMDSINVLNYKGVSGKGCSSWLKVNYNGNIRYVCSDEISNKNITFKIKSKTYVRNGKGTKYKAYKKLSKNNMVILSKAKKYKKSSSCSKGWYKIVLDRSKKKYVCSNYTKSYTDKNTVIVTTKNGANLNKGAKNNRYTSVKYGTSLTLYKTKKYKGSSCNSKYYKVKYAGKVLYICSSNVLVTKSNGVVVSPSGVTVRSKASTSGKSIATINYGDNIALFNTTKYNKGSGCSYGWYKTYVNGTTGYVCSNYVSTSNYSFNTKKSINVKSSNNSSSSNIGTLASGKIGMLLSLDKYTGNGCSKGWYKITYDNKTGWVCSSDTDFDSGTFVKTASKAITRINTSKGYYNTISNWTYRVNEDYAYVRTSSTGSIKDTVYLGTELDYLGTAKATSNCSAGWYKVKYFTNKTGYICKTYVDKYNDVSKTDNSYCNTLKNKGFPASYCPYLSYIHAKHPKWVFNPEKTNVTFLAAVNGESRKNYTQNTKTQYLYSTAIAEAGGWRVANDAYVGFMIDPRSYLNEKNIFTFEDLSYDSSLHTKAAVRSILSGSWLDNDTYANYFVNAGKSNSISPIHLAARVKQETGSSKNYAGVSGTVSTTWNVVNSGYICGSNVNISGNKITVKSGVNAEIKKKTATNSATYTYANGNKVTANSNDTLTLLNTKNYKSTNGCTAGWYNVKVNKSLKGVYNFYNIGSYGDNPVVRGLAAAAGYVDDLSGTPWNTHEKAIKYGASFIANGYINKGQYTLFYQKFNVGPKNYYNKYTHQYMTNILAPASEGLSSYRSYTNLKIIDKAFSFKIPVYNSMPTQMTSHPVVK